MTDQQIPFLVPCPWCGRQPVYENLADGEYEPHTIRCPDTGSGSHLDAFASADTLEDVVAAWNTRAHSPGAIDMAAFLSTHPALSDVESPAILEACEAMVARDLRRVDEEAVEVVVGYRPGNPGPTRLVQEVSPETWEAYGHALRALKRHWHLTMGNIADRMGVSVVVISAMEHGRSGLSDEVKRDDALKILLQGYPGQGDSLLPVWERHRDELLRRIKGE